MIGTITNPATGSAHHHPATAFKKIRPRESLTNKCRSRFGGNQRAWHCFRSRPEAEQGDEPGDNSGDDGDQTFGPSITPERMNRVAVRRRRRSARQLHPGLGKTFLWGLWGVVGHFVWHPGLSSDLLEAAAGKLAQCSCG